MYVRISNLHHIQINFFRAVSTYVNLLVSNNAIILPKSQVRKYLQAFTIYNINFLFFDVYFQFVFSAHVLFFFSTLSTPFI